METLFILLVIASFSLLIVGFFSPTTSLFWYKQERTRTKSATIYAITFIASFILFVILTDKNKIGDTSKNTDNSSNTPLEQTKSKKWTEVYTFKGNGKKKSPVFELTGGESRLKYKYRGESGLGMFAVYVVDEGKDIMKQGGFPEVITQSENDESESSLQKGAGRFYLDVNAYGNWTVIIEEKK